jgi:drug/metabolite transporter (DMT)-like permease
VSPDVTDLAGELLRNPLVAIGIPLALIGAVFLSLGAQFQNRGVAKIELRHGDGARAGLSLRQVFRLLSRPSWLLGSVLLAIAVLFQLTSLGFAPLIVVQPIGVVALVVTAVLNARLARIRLVARAKRAILLCVGGVGVFVVIAAAYAVDRLISDPQLIIVLAMLGVITVTFAIVFAVVRRRSGALFAIVAAGVLFGFVATLAKIAITRVTTGGFDPLTIIAVAALVFAAVLGGYFVQTAHQLGSPDLVIAGLTVVDPIVAVLIGAFVMGEAVLMPWPAALLGVAAGATAVLGVRELAKHHPQTHR